MQFLTRMVTDASVRFAQSTKPGAQDRVDGLWHLSLTKLGAYLSSGLKNLSFGSPESFMFLVELDEAQELLHQQGKGIGYFSYRPRHKEIWVAAHLRWSQLRHLSATAQTTILLDALRTAIARIATASRRPKDFDQPAFAAAVEKLLAIMPDDLLLADRPA